MLGNIRGRRYARNGVDRGLSLPPRVLRDAARNWHLRLFDAGLLARDGVRRQSEQVSAIVGTRIMGRLH